MPHEDQATTEPTPQADVERDALERACPTCDAHPGEWCATVRARNDYLRKLHAARLVTRADA